MNTTDRKTHPCSHCGQDFAPEQLIPFQDELLCPACLDEQTTVCSCCGERIYKTDNSGYVELIGNAKATQNGNSVAGDKLRLTNTNVAIADGNVDIIYIPEKQPALPGKETQGADDKALA